MEEKDIKTVKTTRGELRYYRDWGNYDGGVVMLNAQTIDRYKAIKNEHPDADQYISTYSEKGQGRGNGVTIPEILDIVKSWIVDARRIVVTEREKIEREKIERMKQIPIDAQQMFTLIGMLTALRVKCDTHIAEIRENRTYPLNQSQISRLTEDMMYRYYQNGKVTVWDLYNGATELYKADTMDIPALLPQNRAMVGFLSEQFGI